MGKARYVFKRNVLLKNLEKIRKDMESVFSNFKVAYSFKTNSYVKVISLFQENGVLAEVVSPYEYNLAVSNGFNKSNIIYNGVCKDYTSISDCVFNNGIVNIDNEEDFINILNLLNSDFTPTVGIRLSFDNGAPVPTRFGISLDSDLLKKIYESEENGKVIINGLHCHFTSNRRQCNFRLYGRVLGLYSRIFKNVKNIDFGGNFPSPSQNNNYIEYANEMKKGLFEGYMFYEKYFQNDNNLLNIITFDFSNEQFSISDEARFNEWLLNKIIIIEPGTALVKDAFDVRCNVTHIKKGFIFTDVSFFDIGESAISDKCKIKIINHSDVSTIDYVENYKITGYTCMENDILKKSFSGKIKIGDEIIFMNCGSYSICFSNYFINPPLDVELN